MPKPLSAEREHEIRSLDFLQLIRGNDERTAATTAVTAVCDLLNELDRLRTENTSLQSAADRYAGQAREYQQALAEVAPYAAFAGTPDQQTTVVLPASFITKAMANIPNELPPNFS